MVRKLVRLSLWLSLVALLGTGSTSHARDLDEIRKDGVLRHLGVPYANFVTGSGDGMDVEMMKRFAAHLGVRYEYVATDWKNVIPDLSGKRVKAKGQEVEILGEAKVRGDVIANGLTILPWRQQVVDYADPTFPSGVWLIAEAGYPVAPIAASGDTREDIDRVKTLLNAEHVLTMPNTCLDAKLYDLAETGANVETYDRSTNLNEMVPAILGGSHQSHMTLLDVPDALIAMEKWPGKIKVIGPISDDQYMAPAFRKDAPKLRAAFNAFLVELKANGTFHKLVNKYYPSVFFHFAEFFNS